MPTYKWRVSIETEDCDIAEARIEAIDSSDALRKTLLKHNLKDEDVVAADIERGEEL